MCKDAYLELEKRSCKREGCTSMFRVSKEHHQEFCSSVCEHNLLRKAFLSSPLDVAQVENPILDPDGLIQVSEIE